jgi:CheW-like domain
MTHAFRSISGLATRRRARPAVERATFVVVALGTSRLAFPVEWVERVLHHAGVDVGAPLSYGARTLTVRSVATMLGLSPSADALATRRVLVLRDAAMSAHWCAALVDSVYEVVAVDIALIRPITDQPHVGSAQHAAIRGVFEREGHEVWVLDPARLLREVA